MTDMRKLALCCCLLLATLSHAAPAPLPRKAPKLGPWPVGLWVSDLGPRYTLTLRPDGTARERWGASVVEGAWRIDRRDGSVLCFSDRGGWMGVWYPVTENTLAAGYTGGTSYRLIRY